MLDFQWMSVQEFIFDSCKARMSVMKLGSVTVVLYVSNQYNSYKQLNHFFANFREIKNRVSPCKAAQKFRR